MAKGMKSEAGYTIVEVMASIMILSIAIIPMVGMFDTGLRAANSSGNYDTARALATKKVEQAKSLSYTDVRDTFPSISPTVTPGTSASINSAADSEVPGGFSYTVRKQFLTMSGTGTSRTLTASGSSDTKMIEITITVNWGSGNSYSTTGMIAKDTLQ